jgi:hypothetical protein
MKVVLLGSAFRAIGVAAVSMYLLCVGIWLIALRRIPSPGIVRILRARTRPPYAGVLTGVQAEGRYCYLAAVPPHLLSDRESSSCLVLFEDGRALGPGHAPHEQIRQRGSGRYSHWGCQVYFSSSDNSDPRSNGRVYCVEEQRP